MCIRDRYMGVSLQTMEKLEDTKKATETKFDTLRKGQDADLLAKWEKEQNALKALLSETDDFTWSLTDPTKPLKYIGGIDLSFSQKDADMACAYINVLTYPALDVVYEDYEMVKLTIPYIPGFLAFRELPHVVKLIDKLKKENPSIVPEVFLVDGNGVLHQNGFGFASHLGVVLDTTTIGCSKKIFFVDGIGRDKVKSIAPKLRRGGDWEKLQGDSGRVWGAALKSHDESTDPMIISVGHKISIETAVELVKSCCNFRVPEPIRQADLRSRSIIRDFDRKFKN
eukprot:TRINITY_DN15633_c0_g1_i2.p1 TRINITY_DN15633_c0_g1~~TRINITY_DN15633_c0_g1_i2.p1  ORF type:complete len:283 (+),score=62.53 TRINITY_DN15633_c0_g1_i2:65-913(+)